MKLTRQSRTTGGLFLILIGVSLLYQNCAPNPNPESTSQRTTATSSTGTYGTTTGASSINAGGATPIAAGGTAGSPGGTTGISSPPGSAIPVVPDQATGQPISGVTTGSSTSLIWHFQPDDRTLEEGSTLSLSSYAAKGAEPVSYQWYKNGIAISGAASYMYKLPLVPVSAGGQYYVVARTGTDSIRSQTVLVKVRSARNSCLAGYYGPYPGSQRLDVYWHESAIGRANASIQVKDDIEDGYIYDMPYVNNGPLLRCLEMYQCRNGKFYLLRKLCVDPV